jgi:hypothetical protein
MMLLLGPDKGLLCAPWEVCVGSAPGGLTPAGATLRRQLLLLLLLLLL